MGTDNDIKGRFARHEPVTVVYGDMTMDDAQLRAALQDSPCDLIFIDTQHTPVDEPRLAAFCGLAARLGAPVSLRIRHDAEAHLVGRYLDGEPLEGVVDKVRGW